MIFNLAQTAFRSVLETLSGLWPLLALSMLISVGLKLYVDQEKVGDFLRKNKRNGVIVSTMVAVFTPFCSCGTTAVVLGMMASTLPWAPIVAFLVASPLTSPQETIYSAGLFGWPFAITFMVASVILGLTGGAIASFFEKRGWLKNQARLLPKVETSEAGDGPDDQSSRAPVSAKKVAATVFEMSWKLLLMFFAFSFIGYFLNGMIPDGFIENLFGTGKPFSVPLAALLGLPLYFNTEGSMPMVRAFMDSGMSAGAALAFLITGAGTSIGAFTGLLTIARWRVIAIVFTTLVVGAILLGFGYDILVAPLL